MRPCRGFVTTSICSIQWPTDSPTAWHITFPRVKCAETKSCQSLYSGGVTCHSWSCVVHWGHVWVPWWTHQRGDALSCVHVHVSWRQTEGQKDLESGLLSRLNPHLWNRPPPPVTCANVLAVVIMLSMLMIMLAGLWVHGPVWLSWMLRCPRRRRVLDLSLRVRGALRGRDPRGREELINRGTQVCHLGGVQRPVVELSLTHALF